MRDAAAGRSPEPRPPGSRTDERRACRVAIEDVALGGRSVAPVGRARHRRSSGPPSARAAYRRLYRRRGPHRRPVDRASRCSSPTGSRFGLARCPQRLLLLAAARGRRCSWSLVYQAFHLYDAYRYTPAEEFRRIILAVSMGLFAVLALAFWSKTDFSRRWLGALVGARHRGGARIATAVAQADRPRPPRRDPRVPHGGRRNERRGAAPRRADAAALVRLPPDRHGGDRRARRGHDGAGLPGPGFRGAAARRDPRGGRRVRVRGVLGALGPGDGLRRQGGAARGRGGPRHGHPPRGPLLACRRAVAGRRHRAVLAAGPAHGDPGRREAGVRRRRRGRSARWSLSPVLARDRALAVQVVVARPRPVPARPAWVSAAGPSRC